MLRNPALFTLVLLAAAGCGEELKPETRVEALRVLGMKAEPAELAPGGTATLAGLIVDPSREGKATTVLWLGCDPDPFNLGRSACSDTSRLADPASLAGGSTELPPGMHVIGLNAQAAYTAPSDLFSQLPSDDPRRQAGAIAQVLAFAVAEEVSPLAPREELEALFERVRRREVPSLLSIFRIRVSEEPTANLNPVLTGLNVEGAPLPPGATLRLRPGAEVPLELTAEDASFEAYEQLLPDGVREPKTERLISAWYATTGTFSEPRVALRTGGEQRFTAPGTGDEPLPEDRAGTLWAVVRDTRGGQSWLEHRLFICDPSLGAPAVTAIEPPKGPAPTQLLLRGAGLDTILDVLVGGAPLTSAAYFPAHDVFTGTLPALPPGTYPVVVRGKHCADVDTGLFYEVEPADP